MVTTSIGVQVMACMTHHALCMNHARIQGVSIEYMYIYTFAYASLFLMTLYLLSRASSNNNHQCKYRD